MTNFSIDDDALIKKLQKLFPNASYANIKDMLHASYDKGFMTEAHTLYVADYQNKQNQIIHNSGLPNIKVLTIGDIASVVAKISTYTDLVFNNQYGKTNSVDNGTISHAFVKLLCFDLLRKVDNTIATPQSIQSIYDDTSEIRKEMSSFIVTMVTNLVAQPNNVLYVIATSNSPYNVLTFTKGLS